MDRSRQDSPAPESQAVSTSPGEFAHAEKPAATPLVQIVFTIDESALYKTADGSAVEIEATEQRLLFGRLKAKQARTQIARAAGVRVEDLPIVFSASAGKISIGIMAPRQAPDDMLVERTSGICEAVTAAWQASCQVDFETTRTTQDSSEKPCDQEHPAVASTNPPNGNTGASSSASPRVKLEALERRMRLGLDKLRAGGDVDITFVVGGRSSTVQPIKLKAQPVKAAQNASLSKQTRIVPISVHKLVTSTTYQVRVTGESAMCLATFSSTGKIGTELKALAGWPGVWARVRPYQATATDDAPRHAFRIEEIVGRASKWTEAEGIPSPIEDLRKSLDDLEKLPISDEPPSAKGRSKEKGITDQ